MAPSPNFGFGKSQKLKSRKIIALLFSKGKHTVQYPVCLYWLELDRLDDHDPFLFSVSVPKRKFKKAVERNRIKRQLREIYRLNMDELASSYTVRPDKSVAIMAVYIADKFVSYEDIEKKMLQGLSRILESG